MAEPDHETVDLAGAWAEFEQFATDQEKAARTAERRQRLDDLVELGGDYVGAMIEEKARVGLPVVIGGAAVLAACEASSAGDERLAALYGGVAIFSCWASWMMYKKARFNEAE